MLVAVKDRCTKVYDPFIGTALILEPIFQTELLAGIEGAMIASQDTVGIVWMKILHPSIATRLLE